MSPSQLPGRIGVSFIIFGLLERESHVTGFFVLSLAESGKLICQADICRTQNLDGVERSVGSAGFTDGKGGDGDALGI